MNHLLVATYAYSENYGAHDWDGKGTCPQFWKSKGYHQEVAPVSSFNAEELEAKVEEMTPKSDDFNSFSLQNWEVVDMAEAYGKVCSLISSFVKKDNLDIGYMRFIYDEEAVFDIIYKQLLEEGKLVVSKPEAPAYMNMLVSWNPNHCKGE